jgi:hypothetical protein
LLAVKEEVRLSTPLFSKEQNASISEKTQKAWRKEENRNPHVEVTTEQSCYPVGTEYIQVFLFHHSD